MANIAIELQPCLRPRSGIHTYTLETARRLKDGGGFAFFGNLFNGFMRQDVSALRAALSMPVRVNPFMEYGVYRRIWHALPLPYARMFAGSMDLTHFTGFAVPPGVRGKVITTVYDMTYLRYPETMDAGNLSFLQKEMPHTVARSDLLLTISEFSRQEIITLLDVAPERVAVVPAGVAARGASVSLAALQAALPVKPPYILYVGTLEPRKNIMRLLDAYRRLKADGVSAQLVLAGEKGWKAEELCRVAEGMDGVLMTGFVDDRLRSALYQHAAVFAFPSLYEGFGIPVLEAMQWGTPVVCANAASLPEIASDCAVFADPLDADSIAQGLHAVLTDEALAARLREAGPRNAARYAWDAAADALLGVYHRLLS